MYYNFKLVIIIDNSHVPMVLSLLSISLPGRFFLSLFLSPLFFRSFLFYFSPPFIASILVLITIAVLLPARASGIFSSTLLDSSPPLSWNSDFWGLLVLFRLSHLYLMQQRWGKSPIINAEVKIFNLLAFFRTLPWFYDYPGNHAWITHACNLR